MEPRHWLRARFQHGAFMLGTGGGTAAPFRQSGRNESLYRAGSRG
jgi:hypothetical protein